MLETGTSEVKKIFISSNVGLFSQTFRTASKIAVL